MKVQPDTMAASFKQRYAAFLLFGMLLGIGGGYLAFQPEVRDLEQRLEIEKQRGQRAASKAFEEMPGGKVFTVEEVERAVSDAESLAYDEIHQLEKDLLSVQEEKTTVEQQLSDLLQWMLTNYKGTFPVPDPFMSFMNVPSVTEDFSIDPAVARLLNMNEKEEASVKQAFRDTGRVIKDLEAEVMKVYQPEVNQVVVHIPPFAEEGQLVREDLYYALEQSLGPARFDRMVQVASEQMEEGFLYFGEKSRTMVFEVLQDQEETGPYLRIRDGWTGYEDEGMTKTISATETTVVQIPEEYHDYLEWTPHAAMAQPQENP